MSRVQQHVFTKGSRNVPKIAIGILTAIAILGIFAVGFDTGQIEQAFGISGGMNGSNPGILWLHELSHDVRHAAGFMCH